MFKNIMNFKLEMVLVVLILAGCLILPGCSYEHKTAGDEIEALYWHEGERYTAVTIIADVVTRYNIPPYSGTYRTVTLYTDVAEGEKSWYKCEWDWEVWMGTDTDTAYCDIHIHNIDELGTADWNHGKFGSGSTTRID